MESFDTVDRAYRADLRELNELNFARFDAKLDQRLAQFDAKWERRMAEFDAKWERRVAELRIEIQKVRSSGCSCSGPPPHSPRSERHSAS